MPHATEYNVPLGRAPLRWKDLDESASKFERTIAAPSDSELVTMWTILAVVLALSTLVVAVVFASILYKQQTRKNPFNVYLLFLMIPDLCFSGFCLLTCSMSAAEGHYYSPNMCRFQAWYIVFGLSANSWVNCIIACEIHRLLRSSRNLRKYQPPSIRTVVRNALIAYSFCALFAGIGILHLSWWPLSIQAQFGFFCSPVERNHASALFFWLAYFPLYVGIPYLISIGVLVDIVWRKKMLPPKGRRRQLAFYFFRIIFVFLVMWTPSIFVIYILRGRTSPWVSWSFALYSHLQAMVSAVLTLCKPDVANAVKDIIMLKRESQQGEHRRDFRTSGFGFPSTDSSRFRLRRSASFGYRSDFSMDSLGTMDKYSIPAFPKRKNSEDSLSFLRKNGRFQCDEESNKSLSIDTAGLHTNETDEYPSKAWTTTHSNSSDFMVQTKEVEESRPSNASTRTNSDSGDFEVQPKEAKEKYPNNALTRTHSKLEDSADQLQAAEAYSSNALETLLSNSEASNCDCGVQPKAAEKRRRNAVTVSHSNSEDFNHGNLEVQPQEEESYPYDALASTHCTVKVSNGGDLEGRPQEKESLLSPALTTSYSNREDSNHCDLEGRPQAQDSHPTNVLTTPYSNREETNHGNLDGQPKEEESYPINALTRTHSNLGHFEDRPEVEESHLSNVLSAPNSNSADTKNSQPKEAVTYPSNAITTPHSNGEESNHSRPKEAETYPSKAHSRPKEPETHPSNAITTPHSNGEESNHSQPKEPETYPSKAHSPPKEPETQPSNAFTTPHSNGEESNHRRPKEPHSRPKEAETHLSNALNTPQASGEVSNHSRPKEPHSRPKEPEIHLSNALNTPHANGEDSNHSRPKEAETYPSKAHSRPKEAETHLSNAFNTSFQR